MIGSTCPGWRKPVMAPSTAGFRSVQATATAPGVVFVTACDCPQPIDQREVLGQLWLLEALAVLAPVVVG